MELLSQIIVFLNNIILLDYYCDIKYFCSGLYQMKLFNCRGAKMIEINYREIMRTIPAIIIEC